MLKDKDTTSPGNNSKILTSRSGEECCVSSFKSFIEIQLDGDEALLTPIRSSVGTIFVGLKVLPRRILQKPESFIETSNFLFLPGFRDIFFDMRPKPSCLLHTVNDTSLTVSNIITSPIFNNIFISLIFCSLDQVQTFILS